MSQKVVINKCFGGFGLSARATEAYLARKGKKIYWFTDARDANGRLLGFREPKIRTETPDNEFMAYSYTTPEPSHESYFYSGDIDRDDPDLVAVVEQFGSDANASHASLAVVEIPDGVKWVVDEYDGLESVEEEHRSWG